MKEVPKEKVAERLKSENLWWDESGRISELFFSMKARPYLNIFYPQLTNRQVQRAVVLMGPRRVGKTVMLHHAIQRLINDGIPPRQICYVSVDHPLYNRLDLEAFLEAYQQAVGIDYRTYECFFIFDEIQYLKKWENYLKLLVDRHRNIKFVVSGSAAAALRLSSIESGAGRFTDFLLPPLTFYEYLCLIGKDALVSFSTSERGFVRSCETVSIKELNHHFLNYLNFGGYPEVALSGEVQRNPGQFVKSDIIDKVLLRDLPSLYGIGDIQELNYLFTTLAFNTANEVSLEELSGNSGVAKNTIKRYIEYLEAAFLIKVLHRVDRSGRRFKKANYFKVYLTNPSMRSALFNLTGEDDEAAGRLVETAVYAQWFHINQELYYARWSTGEVDIVALNQQQHVGWAVEVKWSDRYFERPQELKSVLAFCHSQNLNEVMVTSKTIQNVKLFKSVQMTYTPASLYCFTLGYNAMHGRSLLEGLVSGDSGGE